MVPGYANEDEVKNAIKTALNNYDLESAMVSFIAMHKEKCITLEKYEEAYKTNLDTEKREDLSINEDLETFLEKLETNKLNTKTIAHSGDYNTTFLLCLLNTEEQRKLDRKDDTFLNTFYLNDKGKADVPEEEWEASKSKRKYAQSICWRTTFFLESTSFNSRFLSSNIKAIININLRNYIPDRLQKLRERDFSGELKSAVDKLAKRHEERWLNDESPTLPTNFSPLLAILEYITIIIIKRMVMVTIVIMVMMVIYNHNQP